MTIITWTEESEDKIYEKIELFYTENDGILHLTRPYTYVTLDSNGKPRFTNSSLKQDIPWASIPPDIQAALAFIDNYTKEQIEIEAQAIISTLPS
jgi:hypothetical protein